MIKSWIKINLGEACTKIGSGATPRGGNSVYSESGSYSLIRSQNIYNDGFHRDGLAFITETHAKELNNVEVQRDDILLNITGDSVARCCQVDQSILPARVNQHVAIIRPDPDKLNPRFLRYVLVSPEIQALLLSWAGSGGTRNALTKGMIESLNILAPKDLEEQRAIAHILGTLDDKIELNRRMNETLEAMARAIFKSWFVDFDPVRAKAEGRDTGLPKEIADLFPDSFEETELGEVPKGWKITRLQDVLSLDKGLSYKGQFLSDNGKPMVNLGCFLGNGKFTAEAIKGYSGEFKPRHTIRQEDLVIANTDITQKREVIGSPGLVPPHAKCEEFLFSHHVFAARFHEGAETLKLFVLFSLLREEFRQRATGYATGTTVLALPRDSILDYQFARPTVKLIEIFNHNSWPLIYRQWNGIEESRALAKLRDTLLPRLISGELRVKNAEHAI